MTQRFNTGQRFSQSELHSALYAAGFRATRMTYANALLSPPVIVMRLLQRWDWLAASEQVYTDTPANSLFAQVLQVEATWLARRDLPFGISLYALAVKPG